MVVLYGIGSYDVIIGTSDAYAILLVVNNSITRDDIVIGKIEIYAISLVRADDVTRYGIGD